MKMNREMKKHMLVYLEKGMRYDGRALDEYRQVRVETKISQNAEGSARVTIGETEVLAGIKMAVEKPYPDTPEDGSLMVGAELLPLSSPEFEAGPPGIQAIEIARVVDRGIRESKSIDTKQLCIEKGEKAWVVMVDIVTINDAGNLFDASALATIAALKDAVFPGFQDGVIDYKNKTDKKIPVSKEPVSVTVIKIGKFYLVDPAPDEEKVADARISVASLEDGTLCAMQKGGVCTLTEDDVVKMTDLAVEKAKFLRGYLKG